MTFTENLTNIDFPLALILAVTLIIPLGISLLFLGLLIFGLTSGALKWVKKQYTRLLKMLP